MALRKVNSKEYLRIVKEEGGLDLSNGTMTIHIGPYYKWDNKKKDFIKPKIIVTRQLKKKLDNKK